jgi:predicted transcriptional regulator
MSPVARLRLLQLGCIALVLACMALVYWRHSLQEVPLSARHWIVMIAAAYSAIWGFTMQRRIVHGRPSRSPKSTPFTRWRAGNIIRLWSATSLGASAVVLSDWVCPHLVVNAIFAIGLVLLLFWSPGAVPEINS